ncbi:MAG TPA: YfhO family protein [Bryobacteraceae bacterium]|nr:YfhO family protein [Bryobacteraceae bacterium]
MRSRRAWWAYVVLAAEILVFYRRVLFIPGYAIPWDLRFYHYPIAAFAARCLRQGQWPLWDPYIYCGMPVYANLQAQLFYPPALLAIFLSNWLAPDHLVYFLELQLVAHVLAAGLFTYWLLRELELPAVAAVTGATVFQLGAFFASQTQHLGAIDGAAWLPLAMLAVLRLRREFSLLWTGVLALSLAMSILAGFAAVTIVVLGGSVLLAVVLIGFREASWKLVPAVLAAGAWAALLAAIQILPTLELTSRSVAKYRSDFLGTGGGMPLEALVSLVLPNHYSVFDLAHYSLPWNFTFVYAYCGMIGLFLAVLGAVRRSRMSRVFLIVTLFAALAMLGDATPVGRAIFPVLPRILRASIYPEYALALFTLGIAVLAGLGSQKFGTGVLAGVLLAATAADLIAVSANRPMNTASENESPGISRDELEGHREGIARVRRLVDQANPPWRIDTVDDLMTWSSAAMLFEIPDANGNDPFALERYMQVRLSFVANGARWGRYYQVADAHSPVLGLLNVRYLLSRKPVEGLAKVEDIPGSNVYENPSALPRFFLVDRIERVHDMAQALALLRSAQFQPREVAVVEGAPAFASHQDASVLPPVRVLRYEPRAIELETNAPHAAYLVTSEADYPGWRAWIDGSQQPIFTTNVAFRGLPVPAGRHRIEMRFAPPVWRGAMISGIALAALFWCAGSAIISRQRPWTS